ncbi:MAG: HEAT repeat domain-containing protein [Planctomycetes bacterium]|nr:HEAT repeat domain-containing protein [Planctomycetota bacterium]
MLLRIVRASFAIAFAFVLSLSYSQLGPVQSTVAAQDAVGTVKDGIREYKRGNWEKAIREFDKALAGRPTDEEARKIRDEVGLELARDFIDANFKDASLTGRYSRFGKWLLAGRAQTDPQGRSNDAEAIKQYVDAYMSDRDVARKLLRGQSIRDSYGDFIVPYLQARYMHNESADSRYEARTLLRTVGAQAVNALIQVMYSAEKYDRQTAALALGDIGDARALPVLAKHFQAKDEDNEVREACRAAIEWIRAASPEKDTKVNDAKDLYFLQAEGYYRNNAAGRFWRNRLVGSTYQGNLPVALYSHDRRYTAWKWIPGKELAGEADSMLTPQDVPLWAFADVVAEEAALEAIDLGIKYAGGDANNNNWVRDAEALLACIHMHMYTEGRGRYFLGDDTERAFITELLGERGFVPNLHGFGLSASAGSAVLYRALERSLADGYPHVAIALCDAIADLNDKAAIGTNAAAPLVRALADPDKNIRYAAARSLIRLGAEKDFGNNALVEAEARKNLQEVAARTVLVIMEDEALRNRFLSELTSLGYAAVGARTLEEGADLATQGTPWDAIILEGNLAMGAVFVFEMPNIAGAANRAEKAEPIYHLLANDIRTQGVPVLVAVPESELDSRKGDLAALALDDNRYVTYKAEAEYTVNTSGLGQSLDAAWGAEENVENAKGKTNDTVVSMAWAISLLNPSTTKFNVQSLLEALSGGLRLDGRSWAAREAICKAIEVLVADGKRTGAAWVRANLIPNLLDTVNSTEAVDRPRVKASAARALGATYGTHRGAWDEDGFNGLKGLVRLEYDLAETDDEAQRTKLVLEVFDARNAAGEALGRSPTTAQQRSIIKREQAVNSHNPHPPTRTAGGG